MPFRAQETREHCQVCRDLAEAACARCGGPLCAEHMHDDDHRCDRCEREFRRIAKRPPSLFGMARTPVLWMSVAIGVGALAAILGAASWGTAIAVACLGGIPLALNLSMSENVGTIQKRSAQRLRPHFLSERRLPAAKPDPRE